MNNIDNFEMISAEEIDNAIKCIGKDWMLITVKDKKQNKVNAMTASWGALGVLWNKNVCICFVRPQRYTYELLGENDEFSIAFLDKDKRQALALCGKESGRDCDKLKKAGLCTMAIDGVDVIADASLVLICKKLYEDDLKEGAFLDDKLFSNYVDKDYHRFYISEIKAVYKRK